MTTAIEILDLPAQRLLVKHTTCGHKEIGPAFGKAIHHVGQCLRASGGKMAAMPMAVYLNWRHSDPGPHAFASHFGHYDTLIETHQAIMNWYADNGKKISGACFEAYPTDPGTEPDATKWQTNIYYPV